MRSFYLASLAAILVGLLCPVVWAMEGVELSESESRLSGSEIPLCARRLGRVTVKITAPCLNCGDTYLSGSAHLEHIVRTRLNGEFAKELTHQLRTNGIFDRQSEKRISLQVNLLKISHDSSVGAHAESQSPITNGGVMVTSLTLEYILSDGDSEVLRISLSTKGTSDSLSEYDIMSESLNSSLKKNLRIFLLATKAAFAPSFAKTAEVQIQAINAQNESTRSILGSFAFALGKIGNGAVAVVGETVKVLGSPEFAAAVQQANADHINTMARLDAISRGHTLEEEQAKTRQDAAFYDAVREMEADPNSQVNQDKREQERERSAEADLAAASKRAAIEREARRKADARARESVEADAKRKRDAEALKAQQEREKQRLASERRQREQERLEQARQKEQERKQEEAIKKAEAERIKLAQLETEKQARVQYLQDVTTGTRLVATKCPDGEGKYYATGTRPKIKPEVVGCIDVRFRAYCQGSVQYSEGVAHNFIGMAGCFGDTYDISPKPPCNVNQVRIEVIEAMGCGN